MELKSEPFLYQQALSVGADSAVFDTCAACPVSAVSITLYMKCFIEKSILNVVMY